MESGDLKIFQAVVREGSITKAAAQLGYVQSNVTARIRQLEEKLQIPLFYRLNRGISLTSAGKNLAVYADRILSQLDEAFISTRYSEHPNGPLTLGATDSTAAAHLPDLLKPYLKSYPDVKLSLISGYSNDLMNKVLNYHLDAAFINDPVNHPDLQQILVLEEELVLISEPVEAEPRQLLNKPFLFFGPRCIHRERMVQWLKEENVTSTNIMEFGSLDAIIKGVSCGLGVSVQPKSSVKKLVEEGALHCYPIPEKYRKVKVCFIYRRDMFMTSAMKKFIELLEVTFSLLMR
ncbi:LysR family transcriptional regulator [Paenibacillus beijingensis]|uniref:LysR family transcriptional regulator n=1 Tax=Paenibacillus beijingensis TaxID=1126833 RepID=A0A0D5NNQ9_9BACL|nr:LysR family transcriptional regulator [Paenibacillus beijingensis]AJY76954.1 LysR family transcriptional regulator [Paenibacillus beijingensis]